MQKVELNTIAAYEQLLSEMTGSWSSEQRVALAAAMAERWLPAYEAFSTAYEWGDSAVLRHGLDAVWDYLRGRTLGKADIARYEKQLDENTPHMDDFDADEALAACVMVSDALKCCASANNAQKSIEAVLSGFGAVEPDWWLVEEDEQQRLWRKAVIQKELGKQLKLLKQIGALTRVDDEAITALRAAMIGRDLIGKVPRPSAPTRLTNQKLFELYRRDIESELKGKSWKPESGSSPFLFAVAAMTAWMSRYSRRRRIIEGTMYGPMVDAPAQRALVARQKARDAAEKGLPDWNAEIRWPVDRMFENPYTGLDAHSLEELHAYGPSLRLLWAAAKRRGESDEDAWNSINVWATHRPAAWDAQDQRKKMAPEDADLDMHLAREAFWRTTDDLDHPWATEVDGEEWRVRLNDFPDDVMYTLLIGATAVGDFDDWPQRWQRE